MEVTNRPVCAAKERDHFINGVATPPWKGGECSLTSMLAKPACNVIIQMRMAISAMAGLRPSVQRLRLLACYLSGSPVCPGLPPTVVVANTHACNHFCRMCIREAIKFDGPNLEFGLFRKLIDEGAGYFRYISFDGPGETIMNPEAFGMIRYAKTKGIRMVFSTNATLMTADVVESILDSGLDHIIFSLNGTTREVYAAVHGVDAFDTAVANIRHFLKRKCESKAPTMVTIQMV